MIQLFHSKADAHFSTAKWASYLQQMPIDVKERIQRYRKEENKYQLLIGRLLLKYGMKKLGFDEFQLEDLHYNENNYPQWRPEINFNIAHSGNIIGCAFSKNKTIGLDIERIQQVDLNNFEYILNEIDQQNIKKSTNSYDAFFKIWTIKEAVTKALGKGLAIDVQQIYIYENHAELEGRKWHYLPLNLAKGYAVHLVSDEIINQIKIQKVSY